MSKFDGEGNTLKVAQTKRQMYLTITVITVSPRTVGQTDQFGAVDRFHSDIVDGWVCGQIGHFEVNLVDVPFLLGAHALEIQHVGFSCKS